MEYIHCFNLVRIRGTLDHSTPIK
ncbi:hypothetical protein [Exiguobacterium marinum]